MRECRRQLASRILSDAQLEIVTFELELLSSCSRIISRIQVISSKSISEQGLSGPAPGAYSIRGGRFFVRGTEVSTSTAGFGHQHVVLDPHAAKAREVGAWFDRKDHPWSERITDGTSGRGQVMRGSS